MSYHFIKSYWVKYPMGGGGEGLSTLFNLKIALNLFFYYTSPCNFFNACNSSMGLYEHGTPVVELRKKLTFIGISAPKCP